MQQTTPPREGKRIRIGCNETPVIHDRLLHNASVTAEEAELPLPTFELHVATSTAEVLEGCASPDKSPPTMECEPHAATTTLSSISSQELLNAATNDKLIDSLSVTTEEHPPEATLPVRDPIVLNSDVEMPTRTYLILLVIQQILTQIIL